MSDTCPTVRIKTGSKCGFSVINESDFDPTKHEIFVSPPPAALLPPPPLAPPAPFDPLANLPENWREGENLRDLAAAVGGRSVENHEQAVAVIEEALAARQAQ